MLSNVVNGHNPVNSTRKRIPTSLDLKGSIVRVNTDKLFLLLISFQSTDSRCLLIHFRAGVLGKI